MPLVAFLVFMNAQYQHDSPSKPACCMLGSLQLCHDNGQRKQRSRARVKRMPTRVASRHYITWNYYRSAAAARRACLGVSF